jgi:hypothetical protein
MGSVFVTNTNADLYTDRFAGEDYVFPPGERVMIPTDAATHIFGFNLLDKSETLVRAGRAMKVDPMTKQYVEDPEGVKWLARFVFDEAVMVAKSSLAQALEKPIAA